MKKKFLALVFPTVVLLTLPSCALFSSQTIKVARTPVKEEATDHTLVWDHGIDTRRMLSNSGIEAMPNQGSVNMLVVPLSFAGRGGFSSFSSLGYSSPQEAIEKNFFGKSEETGWESVASFYEKSSYGKLHISGEVTETVRLDHNLSYYLSLENSGKDAGNISNAITETAIQTLAQGSRVDLSKYDGDKDGYLDAVWFVYDAPANGGSSDLLWAYTTTNTKAQSALEYKVGTYSWGSYSFMSEGGYDLPDAHTFIHETGHILGLDDYYSYDSDDMNPSFPLGTLDMMDYNIGDHCAFSKYLLNWIRPRQVVQAGTYELKPFHQSGDSIIIANDFNGTPFDEYLILEYYTNDSLNLQDSLNSYGQPYYPRMYSEPGLRILHVDNRLGLVKNGSFTGTSWNNRYISTVEYYVKSDQLALPIASNTPSYSFGDKNNKLVELVSNRTKGDLVYALTGFAENADLFGAGDKLTQYTFNDKSVLPFTIKVDSIDSEKIVLTMSE